MSLMQSYIKDKNNNDLTIDFINSFNIDSLSFTELEDIKGGKGQKNAYPRYTVDGVEKPPFFQLVWFFLESGGVTQFNDFITEEKQRTTVRIPLNLENPLVKKCYEKLVAIDTKYSSNEFKESIFGPKWKKYIYQPIVRFPPEEDESNDKNKKPKSKHPYIKIKIDMKYEDNTVKTIVYNSITNSDNKRTRTKVNDIQSIDDFSKYVCYKSTIRPIIKPFKLWVMASNLNDPKYGISLKMIKVEVEPSAKISSTVKNYLDNDETFIDSDKEESSSSSPKKSVTSIVPPKINNVSEESDDNIVQNKKNINLDEESSDDESDESDKDIKSKPTPKMISKKSSKSESNSEEEIKPVAKKAPKASAKKN